MSAGLTPSPKRLKTNPSTQPTDTQLQHRSQELGKMGALFGSKENAPIYIAGIIAFTASIGSIVVGVFAATFPEKGDLVKGLIALSVSALSFIGGASGRSK